MHQAHGEPFAQRRTNLYREHAISQVVCGVILYLIQAHRDVEQIVALVHQLSDGKNFCVVNLDPRLRPEKLLIERQLASQSCDRSVVRIGAPINWGGISQVYALLDAMAFALKIDAQWEYFINLSGDSIALAAQGEIRDFYSVAKRNGQYIHLAYFGRSTGVTEFSIVPDDGDTFEFELKPFDLYHRVPALVSPEIERLLQSRASSPLFHWKSRGSIHVVDLFPEKQLIIRPLLAIEAAHRKAAFDNRLLWGGRAWFSLERGAVERMLSDPVLAEVYTLLEHFFCPDELFLHTYLGFTNRFKAEEISRQNHWFRNGASGKIHDGMIEDLFARGEFFARKIDLRKCPLINERLKSR